MQFTEVGLINTQIVDKQRTVQFCYRHTNTLKANLAESEAMSLCDIPIYMFKVGLYIDLIKWAGRMLI